MPLKEIIRHQYGDEAITDINKLNRLEKKYLQTSNSLTFLMRCRDRKIIPKGLELKSPVNSNKAQQILNKASTLLLKERINHHRKVKAVTLRQLSEAQTTLQTRLDENTYASLRRTQQQTNLKLDQLIKNKQKKKLNQLTAKTPNRQTYDDRGDYIKKNVVNLSCKHLTHSQVSLLSKGLNFVPTEPRKNYDDFIVNIEKGLQQLAPGGNVDYLRHQISEVLMKSKPQKPNVSKPERQAIQELKEDKAITIVPADKGRATVVIDTGHFTTLVENNLSDQATYRRLNKDPTAKFEKTTKECADPTERSKSDRPTNLFQTDSFSSQTTLCQSNNKAT